MAVKKYTKTQFAQIPNGFIEFSRNRFATELEEKFIALAVIGMQAKYKALEKSYTPMDWEYISTNRISFADFSETMDLTNNTKKIKQSIMDLKSLGLCVSYKIWNVETKKDNLIHDYISIFDLFKINETETHIDYHFCTYFQKFFIDVGNHFQLSIDEIVGLHSAHTIRIYSLLKSKYNMNATKHQFSVEDLKSFLNVDKKYIKYSNFKCKVLEVAKNQINSALSSKFQINYTEIKSRQKVVAIEFEMKSLGEKYYEATNKMPRYKQNQIYKRIHKLSTHEDTIIAGASLQLLDVFNEEKCINLEQTLCKMNIEVINKRLERLGDKQLKIT